jgi:CheY-like chemotaxis protein
MQKFLLVSASKSFLKRNISLLQRRGLHLFTATNGEEALRLHSECQFDLILADLELEEMDGFSLCAAVRRLDSDKKVPVILTCQNMAENQERGEQGGVSAILPKPLNPLQLVETVGKLTRLQMVRSKRVELDVEVLTKAGDTEVICIAHDISNTGILFETKKQLPLGSRIICQFTVPRSSQVVAEGVVIRSMSILQRKSMYGVKFVGLPAAHRRAIDEYVNSIPNSVTRS